MPVASYGNISKQISKIPGFVILKWISVNNLDRIKIAIESINLSFSLRSDTQQTHRKNPQKVRFAYDTTNSNYCEDVPFNDKRGSTNNTNYKLYINTTNK